MATARPVPTRAAARKRPLERGHHSRTAKRTEPTGTAARDLLTADDTTRSARSTRSTSSAATATSFLRIASVRAFCSRISAAAPICIDRRVHYTSLLSASISLVSHFHFKYCTVYSNTCILNFCFIGVGPRFLSSLTALIVREPIYVRVLLVRKHFSISTHIYNSNIKFCTALNIFRTNSYRKLRLSIIKLN